MIRRRRSAAVVCMVQIDKNEPLDTDLSEEVIKVRDYQSSEALKTDIRRIINNRQQDRWRLYEMISKGPFIALMFKQNKPN